MNLIDRIDQIGDSGYAATSTSFAAAQAHAEMIGAEDMYELKGAGIDVNEALGAASRYPFWRKCLF